MTTSHDAGYKLLFSAPELVRDLIENWGCTTEIFVGDQGEIKLLPVTSSITKLKGMLPAPDKALSMEAMEIAIAQGALNS
jgi:hypothetical protein